MYGWRKNVKLKIKRKFTSMLKFPPCHLFYLCMKLGFAHKTHRKMLKSVRSHPYDHYLALTITRLIITFLACWFTTAQNHIPVWTQVKSTVKSLTDQYLTAPVNRWHCLSFKLMDSSVEKLDDSTTVPCRHFRFTCCYLQYHSMFHYH
jgi:hypothetical protein